MRLCELKQCEVINVRDCQRLGCVADIDFDPHTGCILAIIIPGPGHIWDIFARDKEYVIKWCDICQIGPDIILVDVDVNEIFVACKF